MERVARRHDLDALRVGAFLLLIFYHIGMFYVPFGWHVKSAHIIPALETPMGLLDPWRLSLLFFISGAATRFMSTKFTTRRLVEQRSQRLLVPLFFGILIVVPPQSWAEVVEKNGYMGSFPEFWLRYLSFDQSFGIMLPTYNHLWFVAYLWVYTMAATAIWQFLPVLDRFAARVLSGLGVYFVPVLVFGIYRAFLFPIWGETHIIWHDGYSHFHYGTAFLFGLVLARQDRSWDFLVNWRHILLTTTITIVVVGLFLSDMWEDQPGWRGILFAFIREAYAWGVICTLMGYAHRNIRTGSFLLTILTEAVFPFYIIHQTAIILTGHFLKSYDLPVGIEAATILFATIASCLVTYWVALTVPIMRLPLGLKPQPRTALVGAQ